MEKLARVRECVVECTVDRVCGDFEKRRKEKEGVKRADPLTFSSFLSGSGTGEERERSSF